MVRIEGSMEPVAIEFQRAGEAPFIVSDEYSWTPLDDPVAAAHAAVDLLRA